MIVVLHLYAVPLTLFLLDFFVYFFKFQFRRMTPGLFSFNIKVFSNLIAL